MVPALKKKQPMKRSEAIDKIYDYLDKQCHYAAHYFEAEMLVDLLEKDLGMLPPAYNNKTSEFNEDYLIHKWEEES